ncbi:MAG: hypothetical protein J6K20_11700 [Thermoguttaceae bacterium]|nr:hypothetical protein [Thermoguttaceae bacterium]
MNVAVHPFILATQRLPAKLRREPQIATRPDAALAQLRDAQGIASGQRVAAEAERREPFAGRRTPRRASDESTRARQARDGDGRGRLLDVYC